MIVEIDPSDVVSVPHDCDCQKLRTAQYKVVGHMESIEAPPLADGINYDYSVEENEAYAEGYAQAAKDLGYGDE